MKIFFRKALIFQYFLMDITFPKYLEAILKRYIKQTFYAATRREVFSDREFGPKDLRLFAQGAKILSDLFTSERKDLAVNYLNDKKYRAGYLLYFLPLNFCKTQSLLEKLPPHFFDKPKIKILDLGCGPGTFSLALIDFLVRRKGISKEKRCDVEILALDQNYHVLKDAQILHEEMMKALKARGHSLKITLAVRTFDLRRGKPDTLLKNDQFDLIVASNFLNEWVSSSSQEKVKFLEKIYQRHLSSEGFLILMEPGFQKSTRELMELRDLILLRKGLHVYAPCLHQRGCPMLAATDRDWCHFYIQWDQPPFMKDLDRLLKNKNEFLKLSYLIFTSKDLSEMDRRGLKKEAPYVHRVVSNLMGSKGKSEVVICGPAGRWRLTRPDKNQGESNRDFLELKRGDFVYVPKIPVRAFQNDGEMKIEKEDKVGKISSD
jgi:SAM-dependent methyltransferase